MKKEADFGGIEDVQNYTKKLLDDYVYIGMTPEENMRDASDQLVMDLLKLNPVDMDEIIKWIERFHLFSEMLGDSAENSEKMIAYLKSGGYCAELNDAGSLNMKDKDCFGKYIVGMFLGSLQRHEIIPPGISGLIKKYKKDFQVDK